MSCIICGQDAPIVPSADEPDVVTCARCRARFNWTADHAGALRLDQSHSTGGKATVAAGTRVETPPVIAEDDDWDDLYQPTSRWRHDGPASRPRSVAAKRQEPTARPAATTARRTRSHWPQWMILALGASMFSCGAGLVAWSFGENRQELWNVGAPLALAGQATFLIGLVLQLDVIWRQNKQTIRRLDDLDRRVTPLADSALQGSPTLSPATSLGAAAAGDAESLLKELKSRLDRVATRLGRRK